MAPQSLMKLGPFSELLEPNSDSPTESNELVSISELLEPVLYHNHPAANSVVVFPGSVVFLAIIVSETVSDVIDNTICFKMATETVTRPAEGRDQAANLDDGKPLQEGAFVGATLQIESDTQNGAGTPEVGFEGPGLSRDRPGSVVGRQSVRSSSSRTSLRPGQTKSDMAARTFFSYKDNAFQSAVEKVRSIIKPELDGEFLGAWLLTEIDHWDLEREKIVLLTTNSILVVKYNFITQHQQEFRRVMLHIIGAIHVGDFKYPQSSVMYERQHGGIQIRWNQGTELSFGQRWNPWCSDIPWLTLAHHPVLYHPKENETATFNVDEFFEALVQATSQVFKAKRPNEKVTVIEGPIEIESYASVASMVFNQSGLGFFRDRNGLCF
ncbi:tumor protein p63-regulated gene 1-like protein [Babylonia areolata]|uniref:tumor protein p63-regulated gene 1-like protein n=1 Tax=Babylonia areolata TaxID=304850 RepID=UPI003FD5FA63